MACYYFKVRGSCSASVTVLNIVIGGFVVWVWMGFFLKNGFFCSVLFVVLFVFLSGICYFPLSKMKRGGRTLFLPSRSSWAHLLQQRDSDPIVDLGVGRSQDATKEVKGFPEQNAEGLLLFLVLEWNKMKPEKDRYWNLLWTDKIGVWSPGIPFGISVYCHISSIIKKPKDWFLKLKTAKFESFLL